MYVSVEILIYIFIILLMLERKFENCWENKIKNSKWVEDDEIMMMMINRWVDYLFFIG